VSSPAIPPRNTNPSGLQSLARLSDNAWTRIILAIAFLALLPIVNYDFVWDDVGLVLLNPWMTGWHDAGKLISHHMWASAGGAVYHPANYYRPVFMLWLLALSQLTGKIPAFFHLANILLHLVAVLLVIAITRNVTRDRAIALLAGGLFALHPVHVQPIAWIAGATELLCAVFVLASILTYQCSESAESHRKAWFAASVLLFAAGLFSKETAIVLPCVLAAYAWTITGQPLTAKLRRIALRMTPFLLVTAVYLALRVRILGNISETHVASRSSALLQLPLSFGWYVRQLFWPFHMSGSYKPIPVGMPLWIPLCGLLMLCAAGGAVVWKTHHSPTWVLFGTLSLFSLSPVLIEAFTGFQDRYLYLPSVGFCVLIAWAITRISPARVAVALVTALAVVCVITLVREERVWASDASLFKRFVEVNPSPANVVRLTTVYGHREDHRRQLQLLEDALRKEPDSAELLSEIGYYYYYQKQLDAAAGYFRRALPLEPDASSRGATECALGMVDYDRGDLVTAEKELRVGLETDKTFTSCRGTLVTILHRTGRDAEAGKEQAKMP
jgi:tetratricopeptide (TPR) repeat protein